MERLEILLIVSMNYLIFSLLVKLCRRKVRLLRREHSHSTLSRLISRPSNRLTLLSTTTLVYLRFCRHSLISFLLRLLITLLRMVLSLTCLLSLMELLPILIVFLSSEMVSVSPINSRLIPIIKKHLRRASWIVS